jgi:quercetin dioxygenase-like cupin family protein
MAGSYLLFGARLTVHAHNEDTAGRYDLVEGGGPPGTQTPLHRHNCYSEQIHVLEGELTIWAGERKVVLHAGDTFTIPAGTAHVVAFTGDVPSRGLVVASPSGFARLVMETGIPDTGVPPDRAQNMAQFDRICSKIGDEFLGPPGALPA